MRSIIMKLFSAATNFAVATTLCYFIIDMFSYERRQVMLTVERLTNLLYTVDPMGLVALVGDDLPRTEYAPEAKYILDYLPGCKTIEDVTSLVRGTFEYYFDEMAYEYSGYRDLAERIFNYTRIERIEDK